ncbi:hypothetical protein [Actinoplanes sp. HUAS TT8]
MVGGGPGGAVIGLAGARPTLAVAGMLLMAVAVTVLRRDVGRVPVVN